MWKLSDHRPLRDALAKLPPDLRATFAASCAQRIFPCAVRYLKKIPDSHKSIEVANRALNLLWGLVATETPSLQSIADTIAQLETIIPDEEEALQAGEPYAADAIAALIYALESRRSDDPKFATAVAFRLRDALVNLAENAIGTESSFLNNEALLTTPMIKRELRRQRDDFEELVLMKDTKNGRPRMITAIRERAEKNSASLFQLEV